jgi:hypothetical protein
MTDKITIKEARLYPDGASGEERPCLLCGTDVDDHLLHCEAEIDRGGEPLAGAICPGCIKRAEHPGLPTYAVYIEAVFFEAAMWHLGRADFDSHGLEPLHEEWRAHHSEHHDDPVYEAVAQRFLAMPEAEVFQHAALVAEKWGW